MLQTKHITQVLKRKVRGDTYLLLFCHFSPPTSLSTHHIDIPGHLHAFQRQEFSLHFGPEEEMVSPDASRSLIKPRICELPRVLVSYASERIISNKSLLHVNSNIKLDGEHDFKELYNGLEPVKSEYRHLALCMEFTSQLTTPNKDPSLKGCSKRPDANLTLRILSTASSILLTDVSKKKTAIVQLSAVPARIGCHDSRYAQRNAVNKRSHMNFLQSNNVRKKHINAWKGQKSLGYNSESNNILLKEERA
ncbi:required for respiratory growth protein 9 [Striga asiatica]|uniref:Required for respiratory growth protein 9 n=1 Tax=Striga asiatica TaxID=4170 RepID=A0A5A7P5S1_STRAF|nr:required for respiratory growth protein 9 [Striga asiatica]